MEITRHRLDALTRAAPNRRDPRADVPLYAHSMGDPTSAAWAGRCRAWAGRAGRGSRLHGTTRAADDRPGGRFGGRLGVIATARSARRGTRPPRRGVHITMT